MVSEKRWGETVVSVCMLRFMLFLKDGGESILIGNLKRQADVKASTQLMTLFSECLSFQGKSLTPNA